MNYFFGVNNNIFKSELQIPKFRNRSLKPSNLKLFKSSPQNNKWITEEVKEYLSNKYFYLLKKDDFSNKDIFFFADKKKLASFNSSKLEYLNDFTETIPAFRSNLKIFIEGGGFSSYQSEYPYAMTEKKGSILSAVNSLAEMGADKNFVIFKNIFIYPIEDKFKAYIINCNSKKIEEEYELITNYTNLIEINKKLIKQDNFLFTKSFLGIPIYVSTKNKFVSCEHTHPPHEYILSNNKFKKIKELKDEINEIIK